MTSQFLYAFNIDIYNLELGDSENFTITIVEIVIFTIMNTITIVNLLNILIYNTKIKHRFSSTMKDHSFRLHFISIFVDKLVHISCKFV